MGAVKNDWGLIVAEAALVVRSYDTAVSLRQLHYQLVSREVYANTQGNYNQLSRKTAAARRSDGFPALIDRGRSVYRPSCWGSPVDALAALTAQYRLDRQEGQEWSIYICSEKSGLLNQLQSWFGDLGVGITALGGYASQSFVDEVSEEIALGGRPSVLLYVGDFDSSGLDLQRDFLARCNCFDEVVRVALTREQIEEYSLPELMGKKSDPRSKGFEKEHNCLIQVECDALSPDVLRRLVQQELDTFMDYTVYEDVCRQEEEERFYLQNLCVQMEV